MSSSGESREFVRALSRGLAIIESFDRSRPRLTLSEAAKQAKLSRGTARRILMTLETLGYVASADGHFRLTPRALRLGYAYLSSEPLWALTRPYLEAINAQLGETCSIAVLDGTEIIFVARVASRRLTQDYIPIGFRWPAYPTSLGRCLLASFGPAELDEYMRSVKIEQLTPYTITDPDGLKRKIEEVRQRGFASSDREIEAGLRSVAVPIRDQEGKIVAALNTNSPVHKSEMHTLETEYVPVLLDAAGKISELLLWRAPARIRASEIRP